MMKINHIIYIENLCCTRKLLFKYSTKETWHRSEMMKYQSDINAYHSSVEITNKQKKNPFNMTRHRKVIIFSIEKVMKCERIEQDS